MKDRDTLENTHPNTEKDNGMRNRRKKYGCFLT